jgi:hypothetical protein
MKKCYFLLILCTLVIAIALMLTACSKRATGPAGPQGSAGLQGTPGAQGAPGPAGSQIFEGDSVPSSALGNVGDFYINELTDSLYGPKTLSGWGNAISLQGTVGTQGAPGAPGTPGTPGTPGAPGTPGTPGTPGATGAAGAAGSQILSGSTTPTPTTGAPGDYYFDNVTDSLYGPLTSAGWGIAVSLRGNVGATGAAGQNGAPGQTGAQGPPRTANVIYYNWTSFNVPVWGDFDPTYFRREYSINMPSITSQLLDQGVVLVYLEYFMVSNGDTTQQSIDQVPALFYNSYAPTGTQKENLIAELSPGALNFYLSDAMDNNDPGELFIVTLATKPPVTTGYLYRIILIPGGVLGTSVDPHSLTYNAVCKKYGIQP